MRPKSTAETVLIGVWLTVCDRKRPVPSGLAEYTERMVAAIGSPTLRLFKNPLIRWFAHRAEAITLPGVCAHYAARKVAIEIIVDAIDNPILVVLGAGYDGLGYLQAKSRKVFEVDRPEIQSRKRELLEQLPPRTISFVAADLPTKNNTLSFPEPTTFVAEGVFMYLSEQEVEQVLAELPQGCSLVFTFVGIDEKGRPAMGDNQDQIDRMLAALKEPFRWGMRPDSVGEFLRRNGFRLVNVMGVDCNEVDGMIRGEWIAYANKL